ncbi:methylated-DNA--[protein]-cysteine S-methyltransferase [Tannerella forsythia]|uniref:Methylated-DNA--protein-cysteine methyltransferase n=1 Tax=Tannerella forsythia TaxID=28112 RepID=A0A3P1XT90_TANFO|nr:methylated-DNA--[protein]-cysteine S-methyltransferase [Tannerella forsythia]RRD61721.1 methylated-DNA--[protein]-cysteine S-methyltransferase [Tannerella forsythia]
MNYFTDYASPVGTLRIVENGRGITAIKYLKNFRVLPADACEKETPLLKQAITELKAYFAGQRRHFDLPLDEQGTDFQKRVWAALREIPYGQTRSYKQIAEAAGSPHGYRATGMANNRNPISIVTPCHRVIGANGTLTGYGGGLDIKKKLLELEASTLARKDDKG